MEEYFSDAEYVDEDFSGLTCVGSKIEQRGFACCVFRKCNFSSVDWKGTFFSECRFFDCDFSNALLTDVRFEDVEFTGCKMLGVNFGRCKYDFGFEVNFADCLLELADFSEVKMSGTSFRGSSLKRASLFGAKLATCDFTGCDFEGATFDGCDLREADFRQARDYVIDPALNKIRKARFSRLGVAGLLANLGIRIEG